MRDYPLQIIFTPRKEKEKKKKKWYALQTASVATAVKVFLSEYYPKRSEVWRLWQKPAGLDLYCRKAERLSLHIYFFWRKTYYSFLFDYHKHFEVFLGVNTPQKKIYTAGKRWKGLGEKRNEWACEMEMSFSRSCAVLRCVHEMKVKWITGNRREWVFTKWTKFPERNATEWMHIPQARG